MENPIGLYVHIPFCATKCPYCDFYSVKYSSDQEQKYVDSVLTHINSYKNCGLTADTLYFGGGTPSLIKASNIERIINAAKDNFQLSGEITVECNPNSTPKLKLMDYNSIGVNRVSFGMQSGVDKELHALGRTHKTDQVITAVLNAVNSGITNISLDLMLGTPYQTFDSVCNSINLISSLPVTHVSAYMLKVEENTPYYNSKLLPYCADEDTLSDIYLKTVEMLSKSGFTQYEISNFAKDGFQSKHNLKYWHCDDYLGFGAAAHSHFGNRRFCFPPNINEYISTCGTNEVSTDEKSNGADEYIMLNLRLTDGIDLSLLNAKYGISKEAVISFSQKYILNGLAKITNDRLYLTPNGFLLSNTIICNLIQNVFSS